MIRLRNILVIFLVAVAAVVPAACAKPTPSPVPTPTSIPTPTPTPAPPSTPALSGGILVTFDVLGERYSVFVTNTDTIATIFAVQQGLSQATIPDGKLVAGQVFYNLPWHWHIDSQDIQMAQITAAVSDGRPSQVEANLDYWLNTVKRFSPWHAKIVQIQDFR